MTASKTPRSKARVGLKSLMGPRATADQTAGEIFPFDLPSIDLTTGLPTGSQYDDRAIVLITASVVEQALETLLLAKFIPLSDDDERTLFSSDGGALSTFEAKVQLGFALGSYGRRARDDLTMIRHIRNTFAHSRFAISFETEEVIAACETLQGTVGAWAGVGEARHRFIWRCFDFCVFFLTAGSPEDEARSEHMRRVLDLP